MYSIFIIKTYIVHGDIKPQNILVCGATEDDFVFKIRASVITGSRINGSQITDQQITDNGSTDFAVKT